MAREPYAALKGGTAINLFHRDMPRLSVDIDLTYLPVRERAESLADIDQTLDRIVAAAIRDIPKLNAHRIDGGGGGATRIRASLEGAEVKIETSPVTRGVVHEPEILAVCPAVEGLAFRSKALQFDALHLAAVLFALEAALRLLFVVEFALDPAGGAMEDVDGSPEQFVEVGFEPGIAEGGDEGIEDVGDGSRDLAALGQWSRIGLVLEGTPAKELQFGDQ